MQIKFLLAAFASLLPATVLADAPWQDARDWPQSFCDLSTLTFTDLPNPQHDMCNRATLTDCYLMSNYDGYFTTPGAAAGWQHLESRQNCDVSITYADGDAVKFGNMDVKALIQRLSNKATRQSFDNRKFTNLVRGRGTIVCDGRDIQWMVCGTHKYAFMGNVATS
jgi:hypothetical protein